MIALHLFLEVGLFCSLSASTSFTVQNQEQPKHTALEGHKSAIEAVAISPNGKLALSVESSSNDVHLWSLPSGKKVKVLSGPLRKTFRAIKFSPDDKHVIAAFDSSLIEWDLDKPGVSTEIKLGEGRNIVNSFAYSKDGKVIAIARGEELLLLDRKTKEIKQRFPLKVKGLSCLLFSSDSKHIFGASYGDWNLRGWTLESKQPEFNFTAHSFYVAGIDWINDDKALVSASWDGSVISWDLSKRKSISKYEVAESVSCVSYCARKNLLAVATLGDGIHLLDARRLEKLSVLHGGHSVSAMALSPDGTLILVGYGGILPSSDNSGTLMITNIAVGKK